VEHRTWSGLPKGLQRLAGGRGSEPPDDLPALRTAHGSESIVCLCAIPALWRGSAWPPSIAMPRTIRPWLDGRYDPRSNFPLRLAAAEAPDVAPAGGAWSYIGAWLDRARPAHDTRLAWGARPAHDGAAGTRIGPRSGAPGRAFEESILRLVLAGDRITNTGFGIHGTQDEHHHCGQRGGLYDHLHLLLRIESGGTLAVDIRVHCRLNKTHGPIPMLPWPRYYLVHSSAPDGPMHRTWCTNPGFARRSLSQEVSLPGISLKVFQRGGAPYFQIPSMSGKSHFQACPPSP